MKPIIVYGDLHSPWTHADAFEWATSLDLPIKRAVQVGDARDMLAYSKFAGPTIMTPPQEMEAATEELTQFWKTIKTNYPRVECYQLKGNHCDRPKKRLYEAGLHYVADLDRFFTFRGVKTIYDVTEPLVLDDIHFMHGYGSGKLGDICKKFKAKIVCGHSHRGGVYYENTIRNKIIWELNAGFLGDPFSKAMSYRPVKWTHWTLGVGYINSMGVPMFIPYPGADK